MASSGPPYMPSQPARPRRLTDEDLVIITARLKVLAQASKAARIPFSNDDSEHYRVFTRALSNVLSTELALETFAQIIDGLPTADIAWDRRHPNLHGAHPIEEHEDIRPGVLERARQFRADFDPCILSYDPKPLRAFRRAAPGSRVFTTRLIELIAVALHQIGTLLHQLELRMHNGDIESVLAPELEPRPYPTLFTHPHYVDHDVYPDGVADMVGYWAEDRVLGGVTVFDLQSEKLAPQFPPNVFFHSCRFHVTHRYYQLRDDQQQAMLDFLLAENPDPSATPFPILADNENVVRINEEQAIFRQLYRDIWERKPPTGRYIDFIGRRPRSVTDYPEYIAFIAHLNTLPTVDIIDPSGLKRLVTHSTSEGEGKSETSGDSGKQERKRKREDDPDE